MVYYHEIKSDQVDLHPIGQRTHRSSQNAAWSRAAFCLHRLSRAVHFHHAQHSTGGEPGPRAQVRQGDLTGFARAGASGRSRWTRTGGSMKGSESAGRYQDGAHGFQAANISDTELRGAMLSWAILNRASLRWASLVNLWTFPTQLTQGSTSEGTVHPDGEIQTEAPLRIPVTER